MSITFNCANETCKESFTVSSKFAGKTAKCKLCGTKNTVPVQLDEGPVLDLGSTNYEFYKNLNEQKKRESEKNNPRRPDMYNSQYVDEATSKGARGTFGAIFMVIGFILLLLAYYEVCTMPHGFLLAPPHAWDLWAVCAFKTSNYFFSGWFFLFFGRLTQLGGKAF